MEPSVEYYSKDFDWATLQTKYQPHFQSKDQEVNPVPLLDYEKSWETFYQINQENFFKDRKYLVKSFEEIQEICMKTRKKHNFHGKKITISLFLKRRKNWFYWKPVVESETRFFPYCETLY